MIPAYPLQWPTGWKRTDAHRRTRAKFGRKERRGDNSWLTHTSLTIEQATRRVREELQRMRVRDDDLVINTNLLLRLDGFPRSGQPEPKDPGVTVYWLDGKETRCMAV